MIEREGLRDLVARALDEDIGDGDITSLAVVGETARARARIVQKEDGVICGLAVAEEAFAQAGSESCEALVAEGEWREAPAEVALVEGPARALLAGERVALNLLGHLSGIATLTARFVSAAAEGGPARILDTRKTTPGLRALEKAAVRAGGGYNHRMGLHDAVLIKENHVALGGGIAEAVRKAREALPDHEVEVECRDLAELRAALEAGAGRILLDNMDPATLLEAVELTAGRIPLEASGGVSLENVAEVAATGVDYISIGVLTHSAPALDLSLLLDPLT